ncbi:MAG: PIN domain-containing protein [Candidatus Coatesbacteria bacterium]
MPALPRAFVDTSAWYAYIRADDPDHRRIRPHLDPPEARLVTSNFVFDEVVTLVSLRLGHAAAVRAGTALRGTPSVECVRILPEDEEHAWTFFVRHRDKDYSYTDCTSFALMRRLGLTLAVTTDRHFRQAGFDQLP